MDDGSEDDEVARMIGRYAELAAWPLQSNRKPMPARLPEVARSPVDPRAIVPARPIVQTRIKD
jgi:hypothetical protein